VAREVSNIIDRSTTQTPVAPPKTKDTDGKIPIFLKVTLQSLNDLQGRIENQRPHDDEISHGPTFFDREAHDPDVAVEIQDRHPTLIAVLAAELKSPRCCIIVLQV
jgi:hypothetical protein